MWEKTIRLPARWLTLAEALDHLGVSEGKFRRAVARGLVEAEGKGNGQRFDAEQVWALGVLWKRLAPLLGKEPEPPAG